MRIYFRNIYHRSLLLIGFLILSTTTSISQIPTGNFIWLRADAGVKLNGEKVLSWKDQVHGFDFVPGDTASLSRLVPNAIGTFPAVQFDGYQYLEGPPVYPIQSDYTISAVITIDDTTAFNNVFSGDHHAFWLPQNTYPALVHSDHFFTMAVSRVGVRQGPNIITVRYSEATQQAKFYVNGVFGDSLFVDSNLDSSLYIGAYQRSYFLRGAIGELILYKRQCSEDERARLEQYFFSKYNLTKGLPLPLADSTFTEIPEKLQFYPRESNDSAIVPIMGTLYQTGADSIYCIVSKNNIHILRYSQPLHYVNGKAAFFFSPTIHAELSEYSFEVGTISGSKDSILTIRDSIVCGDAYLIGGQSNAIFGYSDTNLNRTNEYCRTFGQIFSKNIRDTLWTFSTANYYGDAPSSVSGWGLQLQHRILNENKIPSCIINGSYSGTIIEYHEPDSTYLLNLRSIYGRMLYRSTKAKLAKAAKAIFWIHGELYSTVDTYYSDFKNLYEEWRKDYPGLQKIYLGQLRPSYCANIPIVDLRNLQRTIEDSLPLIETFALSGLPYQDGCHFHDSGWIAFGNMIYDLVATDFYKATDTIGVHSPHIVKAFYTSPNRDEISIVFRPYDGGISVGADTTVLGVAATLKDYFYFDDPFVKATNLSTSQDTLKIKLNQSSLSTTISYVPERFYNNTQIMYEGPWLTSNRGVGTLIFYQFPIQDLKSDTNPTPYSGELTLETSPNPVVNLTSFRFKIARANFVSLVVYDLLGRKITTLVDEEMNAGTHEVEFDGINLPAGEYFCRLQAGDHTLTQKIILTK